MSPIYLRVSEGLKTAIEKRALEEGVSVNEFAAHILAEAVEVETETSAASLVLDIDATVEYLSQIAMNGRASITTYGDVAKHQGHAWSWQTKSAVRNHLISVWHECRRRGLPALTSLVVAKPDGAPSPGFIRLERRLGREIGDAAAYVAQRQNECRDWARRILKGEAFSFDPWPHLRGTWKGPDVDDFQEFMRGPADETAAADR